MNIKKYKVGLLAIAMLGMSAATASAAYMADISATGVKAGNTYTFTFDVKNTSDGASTGALDYFEIFFDADANTALYTNITWLNDQGWSSNAYQDDTAFGGSPGLVNADDSFLGSGGGGIAQGAHHGGFTVQFDYAGALSISDQLFSWHAEFGTEDDGQGDYIIAGDADGTSHVQTQNPVPEPATLLLMGTGLAGLIGARRKKSVA